ncbi:MAG: hypothetical protein HKO95_11310 [Rhodobacteraceae bacterium]|nr:hypothetical protein [Alphaproteobacteria bacterium]NNF70913.1 hypothetical protein [Paracoccaceae bacterium]NNK67313.1 hypothetical protein [Paracoccaceae bacterium]
MNIDMTQFDQTGCHFWLTQGMARTAGVNIGEEIALGRLTIEDFGGMVSRCEKCERSEPCVRWMAEGGKGAPDIPGYCLNHEIIEALRDR